MIKLIDAVRKARYLGCKWIAVDEDCYLFGYKQKPCATTKKNKFLSDFKKGTDYILIGDFDLRCDWKKSLIELSKIKVK